MAEQPDACIEGDDQVEIAILAVGATRDRPHDTHIASTVFGRERADLGRISQKFTHDYRLEVMAA